MFSLKGKTALITGSSQGIGLAIAKAFINAGADVYVHCRNISKAQSVADSIKAYGAAAADLSDVNSILKLYNNTGDIDILVCNASIQYRTPWDKISMSEFDEQINVNLKSTLMLMQQYFSGMKKKGWGRILTVGSVQQYKPHKDMAVYAASKCAVMSLVQNLARQVASFGITVNNLFPGVIETPRNEEALSDKEYKKKVLQGIPAGYAGEPEDCIGGALLLYSNAGRYITGINLEIDGGMFL